MTFPLCSPAIAPDIRAALFDLGIKWADDPERPRISPDVGTAWSQLIADWISDRELPLLVRKHRDNRGSLVPGTNNRTLVPTDNSPAQWAFAVAHTGRIPRVGEIIGMLESAELPVAMTFKTKERRQAVFKGVRSKSLGTSDQGWKLAHIKSVGIRGRGGIDTYSHTVVEAHFTRFMDPANMLVVPAEWAGLGEVEAFIHGFCSAAHLTA